MQSFGAAIACPGDVALLQGRTSAVAEQCSSRNRLKQSASWEVARALGKAGKLRRKHLQFMVSAKIRKGKKSAETEYPWPEKLKVLDDQPDGSLAFLTRFKPLPTKPRPVPLPFELPLADLEKRITEVNHPSRVQ